MNKQSAIIESCMKASDFDYDLPDAAIAVRPPHQRGTTKLLVLDKNTGTLIDKQYSDIAAFLENDDILVINDTKVIKARLFAQKENGAERELIILEKHGEKDDWYRHKVLYRRTMKAGDRLSIGNHILEVEMLLEEGVAIIKSKTNLLDLAEEYGEVPLPPYLHRKPETYDAERYQTVWAKYAGSVAAPTASLNMTDKNLANIKAKGVKVCPITLHVGLGTFLPIRTEDLQDHIMHQEYFYIPLDTIKTIQIGKKQRRQIVALGTTVARTLEYAADKLLSSSSELAGEADIFIYPGYKFKVVDALITNFHAPKSTVLMMAAAFSGWEKLKNSYEYAKKNGYNFLSYGDSMLIK